MMRSPCDWWVDWEKSGDMEHEDFFWGTWRIWRPHGHQVKAIETLKWLGYLTQLLEHDFALISSRFRSLSDVQTAHFLDSGYLWMISMGWQRNMPWGNTSCVRFVWVQVCRFISEQELMNISYGTPYQPTSSLADDRRWQERVWIILVAQNHKQGISFSTAKNTSSVVTLFSGLQLPRLRPWSRVISICWISGCCSVSNWIWCVNFLCFELAHPWTHELLKRRPQPPPSIHSRIWATDRCW